ncbi:hypothetical protein VaNZ11_010735, partial [Volvox africanus]
LWGASVPVFTTSNGGAVVSVARYGKGRVGIFSAERIITECCRPNPVGNETVSEPLMDKLIFNLAVWAGYYGYKSRGSKSVIRVADPQFLPLARYVVEGNNTAFQNTSEANISSYYLSLSTFIRGGHSNCDLYVIGSYDESYRNRLISQFITNFVFNGKGLIVVGPDVMPSIFYGPDSPPSAPSSPALPRRFALEAGRDEPTEELWGSDEVEPQDGRTTPRVRRSLQLIANMSNLSNQDVLTRMQAYITGIINSPGGALLLSGSQTGNALIAAQLYISYLNVSRMLSKNDLYDVITTVNLARKTVPRDNPDASQLVLLLDTISDLELRMPSLPPLIRISPDPPPPMPRPPTMWPPPKPFPPPPPPFNLPPGVVFVGCFNESVSQRTLDTALLENITKGFNANLIRLGKLKLSTRNSERPAPCLLPRRDAATGNARRAGALARVSAGQEEQVRARTRLRAGSGVVRRRRQPHSALTPMRSGLARMTRLCQNGIAIVPSSSVGKRPMFVYSARRVILRRMPATAAICTSAEIGACPGSCGGGTARDF